MSLPYGAVGLSTVCDSGIAFFKSVYVVYILVLAKPVHMLVCDFESETRTVGLRLRAPHNDLW